MKKFYILILLIFTISCNISSYPANLWISNTQNEQLYVSIDGMNNISHHKLAILQHGLASNMNHVAIQTAKKAFLDNHYVVITFDSRHSLGKSDNEVEKVRLQTFYEDLQTVVNWAKTQKFYQEPFALAGHSLGGASVLMFAAQYPDKVSTLIPITPVISGDLWEKSCMKNMTDFCHEWKQNEFYQYTDLKSRKTVNIPYAVITDSKNYNAQKIAPQIKAKTLLIGAQNDIITDEKDFPDLVNGNKLVINSSGHNFENIQNQNDLYQAITAFLAL